MKRTLCILAAVLLMSCASTDRIDELDVHVLYPIGGRGDASLADSIFAGIVSARVGARFTLTQHEPEDPDDAAAVFERWIAGANERRLIVLGAGPYADMVRARGCDFGGATVLLLDASVPTCDDLRSVTFRSYGPAFLAGVAAVSDPAIAPRGRVGIIAAADIPPVRELVDGFSAGVVAAGGTVVHTEFIGTDPSTAFDDADAAEALAEGMLDDVDVIYAAAGRSGEGVAEALEERLDDDDGPPVYLVASDTDQSVRHGAIVLGSVLKRFDWVVRDAVLELVAGGLTAGDLRVGFRDRLTEFVLHPLRAASVISGSCECDPYEPACYRGCATLEDLAGDYVADAEAAADAYEAP